MQTTEKALLILLRRALFAASDECPSDTDYDAVLFEARQQSVLPLVYTAALKRLPEAVRKKWQEVYYCSLKNTIRVRQAHRNLHELISPFPYTSIKGVASAMYYPEPVLRSMGDVDFFPMRDYFDKCARKLKQLNFSETVSFTGQTHNSYRRSGEPPWEMHWSLSGIPKTERGDQTRKLLSDVVSTSTELCVDSGTVRVPDTFHHGLILLIHTAEHITQTGIGLRHLCDWAVFVHKTPHFSEIFEDKLQSCGLWHFAQLLTRLSVYALGLPKPQWLAGETDQTLMEDILCDIFASGNFGKKDAERINEAKLLTDRRRGGVDETSMVSRFLKSVNEKARTELPICSVPFFLPLGWVYVVGRHLIKILQGDRPPVHLKKMVSGAEKRRRIYAQFHLYENPQ